MHMLLLKNGKNNAACLNDEQVSAKFLNYIAHIHLSISKSKYTCSYTEYAQKTPR